MIKGNIFNIPPKDVWNKESMEITDIVAETKNSKIEIISSKDYKTPKGIWYDQDKDEFVALLSGFASIEFFSGEKIELSKGDYVIIPKKLKHRVECTSSIEITQWLTFFYT
jgi:cupin 2 domain-containing protein